MTMPSLESESIVPLRCVHCGCTRETPCEIFVADPSQPEPLATFCTQSAGELLCSRCQAFPVGFTTVAVHSHSGEPDEVISAEVAFAQLGLDLVTNSTPPPPPPTPPEESTTEAAQRIEREIAATLETTPELIEEDVGPIDVVEDLDELEPTEEPKTE